MTIPRYRIKNIATLNDEVLYDTTDPETEIRYVEIGDVRFNEGIVNKTNYTYETAPSRARRVVREGDVIISTVRTYLKAVAPIRNPGPNLIVSTGFAVVRPKKELLCPAFAGYLLLSEKLLSEVVSRSVGVSYPAVNPEDISNLEVHLPPLPIQKAIAAYLDKETARIDALIAKKERQIELLEEKRQAIITRAITKGLDPKARMKDSGVEWIGEIPEGWQVKKLRYLGTCQNGISKGGESFGSGFPFVSYGDAYNNSELPQTVEGLVESTEQDRDVYSVQVGDVLFTRTSETVGEIGYASTCMKTIKDAVFAGFLIRFRPINNILHTGYSKYYFRASILRRFFVKEMSIVTRASLSQDLLKSLPVLLPPYEEMNRIADYLDRVSTQIEELKIKLDYSIELLIEYRSSLITAVVSGQIDVSQEEAK